MSRIQIIIWRIVYFAVFAIRNVGFYKGSVDEIEQMPLSWAGNFIGPELGTLEEGAILSALYLFILGKTKKV